MENEGKSIRRIRVLLTKVRQMPFVRALNSFMTSPVGVAMIAALTVIVNATATEMILYVFAVLYGIYLCILGDDFLTLTPLFLFCYIAPARVNNPGRNNASVFTGATGTAMIVMVAVLIVFVLARIALDPRLGFKRLLLSKRALLRGMLVLGLAYALSGLFSAHYGAIWYKNVLFGLLQFATVFLLYFLFTVLVDWDKAPKYYFAWVGFFVGCTLALEVFFLYLQFGTEIITNGVVSERWNIYLGWGMHNNIGAMLAVTVPFAFCLAGRYRHGYLLLLPVIAMLAAICMTMSRTAIGAGLFAAVLSAILMILHYKKRKTKLIIMGVLLASVALVAPFLGGVLISKLSEALGNGLLNDSGRSALYRAGLDVFLNNPVFGEGFYPSDLSVFQSAYWLSGYDISGFLPPRWHNTVIQLLASCGAVGLAAYCYHRYQTVRVFLKGYSRQKLFIAISVACFLGMSLLDCHFFNLGPTMFYSLALTFAECTQEA